MSLKEQIESCRPEFNPDIFPEVVIDPKRSADTDALKGAISEAYVSIWLSQIPSFKRFYQPEELIKNNGYEYRKSDQGILVLNNGDSYCELDNLVEINGISYGVEVKALKLNGIEGQLEKKLEVSREITGEDNAQFLLFFPQYTNKVKDRERIERNFPDVMCIDTGYKKKQIENLISKYSIKIKSQDDF